MTLRRAESTDRERLHSLLAGYLLTVSSFGWPLLAAGCVEIAYDLMLLANLRTCWPLASRISIATGVAVGRK